jgi:hypothetical protein
MYMSLKDSRLSTTSAAARRVSAVRAASLSAAVMSRKAT